LPTWTQLAANALMTGAAYALVACSFNLVYRVVGYYYIILGALLAVAPIAAYWLATTLTVSLPLAALAGIAASVTIAMVDHWLVYRPMKARNAASLALFLGSTAAYFLVTNGLLWVGGPEARAFSTADLGVFELAGARVPVTGGYLIMGATAAWLSLLLWMRWSRTGMAMRAVADDEELAAIVGMPVRRIRLAAVIVAAIVCGCAGILIGLNQSIRFNMGMPLLLKGILASVVAGLGNISFAGLAGLLVGALEIAAVATLPSGLKDVVLFGCLAIVLVVRPEGLITRPSRRA
jgi:branched-subunit amino acid ABC-type transport system permease component